MPVTIKRIAPKAAPPSISEWPEGIDAAAFQCQLAASEIPTAEQVVLPVVASFKLDGIRSPITGGIAKSRKMLSLPNRFMQGWVKRNQWHLNGLDGEMIVGPPNLTTTFNTTTSGIMSADGEPDFKFYVFDKWDHGSQSTSVRNAWLRDYFESLPTEVRSRLVLVEQRIIYTLDELRAYYDLALELGYEGLILRKLSAPYKFGRSTILEGVALKWKEFIDYTCVVVSVKQGMKNNNEKVRDELGRAKRSTAKAGKVPVEEVGGFVVECIEKESVHYGMQFNCGPGPLTQNQLKQLWLERESVPGRKLRVKSQKLGGKTLPRFPGFYGWLHDMNLGVAA